MPFKPEYPGEKPTLGYYALDWIIDNLAAPDRMSYEPLYPTQEQADFILDWYELHPKTGRRVNRRGVLSRPRGWGKSPFVSALALLEGLGDIVFDGWDASGRPVGKPWLTVRTPLIYIVAASEEQTSNSWGSLLEMLHGNAPVFNNYPGIEPMGGQVNLPWGTIAPATTSSTSLKGKRSVFMICDQTEQWTPSNGATKVYDVIANNCYKVGGSLIETPNAYTPGVGSQAERTATAATNITEGRNRHLSTGMLFDHREAPPITDLADPQSLLAGLRWAYGDSSAHPDGCVIHEPACEPGWVDLDVVCERIWQTDADPQLSRSDWLNQITHATDSWITQPEWAARADPTKHVADRDMITLGFDGSRGRARGKPDATALVGCRVSDGHLFEVGVWEAGDNAWDEWSPPLVEIEAALRTAFHRWNVVGFYADPAKDWRSYVNKWEAEYGAKVTVKARRDHPFEWWMTDGAAGKVQAAVEALEGAIRNGDLTHSGEHALTRHVLNARRRLGRGKLKLGKSNDYSPDKIDAAVAAVLAWQARLDALAGGVTQQPRTSSGRVRRVNKGSYARRIRD